MMAMAEVKRAMESKRYVVDVLCTGMGYAQSKQGGDTIEEARIAEERLRDDDSAWVNPALQKQTRIRDTVMGTVFTRHH